MFKVAPRARYAKAATEMNLGKLGSIIPVAASPLASRAISGKKTEGLSRDEVLFLLGALSSTDSRPSLWFVRHIGSPE